MKDVIGAFKKTLPTLKWMDKSSASAAAEKVLPQPSQSSYYVFTCTLQGLCYSSQSWIPYCLAEYRECRVCLLILSPCESEFGRLFR